jgi:hypothetical protein
MDPYTYKRIAMGLRGNKTKRAIAKGAPNADMQAPADCILGADGRQIAADNRYITTGSGATHMREGDGAESLAVVRYGLPTSRKNE